MIYKWAVNFISATRMGTQLYWDDSSASQLSKKPVIQSCGEALRGMIDIKGNKLTAEHMVRNGKQLLTREQIL